MLSMIPIGLDVITGMKAYVLEIFGDVSYIVVLVIGLPLAFYVIRRMIGLARAR